jgi:hypothetical protein
MECTETLQLDRVFPCDGILFTKNWAGLVTVPVTILAEHQMAYKIQAVKHMFIDAEDLTLKKGDTALISKCIVKYD